MAVPQYNTVEYNANQYDASTTFWTRSLSETQGSSDTRIGNEQPVKTEALTGTDALIKLVQQAALAESISESDARTVQELIVKLDSLSESDQIANFVNSLRADALTPSDSSTKSASALRMDSQSMADAIANFVSSLRTDILSLNDPVAQPPVAMYNAIGYNAAQYNQVLLGLQKLAVSPKADTITPADTFSRVATFLRTLGDASTLSDTLSNLVSRALTESLSESDAKTVQDFIARLEAISGSDAVANFFQTSKAESVSAVDALAKLIEAARMDGEITMDAVVKAAINGHFETMTMSDTQSSQVFSQKNETLALAESFVRVVSYIRLFGESMTVSDIRALFIVPANHLDAILATDILVKQVTGKILGLPVRVKDWLDVRRVTDIWS